MIHEDGKPANIFSPPSLDMGTAGELRDESIVDTRSTRDVAERRRVVIGESWVLLRSFSLSRGTMEFVSF